MKPPKDKHDIKFSPFFYSLFSPRSVSSFMPKKNEIKQRTESKVAPNQFTFLWAHRTQRLKKEERKK